VGLGYSQAHIDDLGLEMAIYGYLTFGLKCLDDLEKSEKPDSTRNYTKLAADLTQRAECMHAELHGLVLALTEEVDGSISVYWEPGEVVLPADPMRLSGNLELFLEQDSKDAVMKTLFARGYRKIPASGQYMLALQLDENKRPYILRLTLVNFADEPRSCLSDGPTARSILLALSKKPQLVDASLRIVFGSREERLLYLRDLDRGCGAVDLPVVAELADRICEWQRTTGRQEIPECLLQRPNLRSRGLLEFLARYWQIGAASPDDISETQRGTWRLLDALDARTRQAEALTKFLASRSSMSAVDLLYDLKISARIAALIRLGSRLGLRPLIRDLRQVRRSLADAREGQRVPPRIYLTRAGRELTALRRDRMA
jgi:hypothetical protein